MEMRKISFPMPPTGSLAMSVAGLVSKAMYGDPIDEAESLGDDSVLGQVFCGRLHDAYSSVTSREECLYDSRGPLDVGSKVFVITTGGGAFIVRLFLAATLCILDTIEEMKEARKSGDEQLASILGEALALMNCSTTLLHSIAAYCALGLFGIASEDGASIGFKYRKSISAFVCIYYAPESPAS